MRIAIIGSRGIPARYGGFETFAQELAPRLVRLGHDVTVYCRKGYTGDPPPREFRGVRLVHTPCLRVRSLETISHEFTSILHSLRTGFDLHYFLGTRSAPLYWLVRPTGRKVVVHTDGIEWKRRKWSRAGGAYLKAAESVAVRVAHALVADSEAMCRYYRSRHGRDPACIRYGTRIVTGAPDGETLARFGLEPGGYYLVLCRLEPENNVDLIIREFLASGSPAELAVVGDANYETPYLRRLRELSQCDRVRFLGSIYDPSSLDALRLGARAYVHGHEVGGANPALIEAMGAGCCALVLDTEFNREVVAGAGLTWTNTAGSLFALFRRVDERPREANEMGDRARMIASECYDWEATAAAHDRLFHRLASGTG